MAWPENGSFTPAEGQVCFTADIRFAWPAVPAAQAYRLAIWDADGTLLRQIDGITENSCPITLELPESGTRYFCWTVEAIRGNVLLPGPVLGFSACVGPVPLLLQAAFIREGVFKIHCLGRLQELGDIRCGMEKYDTDAGRWVPCWNTPVRCLLNPDGTLTPQADYSGNLPAAGDVLRISLMNDDGNLTEPVVLLLQ
jgi:hypothetical protein